MPGAPDQVDLVVTVEEKPTGNLSLGAGYSSAEQLTLSASIQQENVFGSGHFLGLEHQHRQEQPHARHQHRRPVLDGRWRVAGLRPVLPQLSPLNTYGDNYQITTWGGAVRFGVPFSELDTVFFGLGYEQTHIADDAFLPNSYFLYRAGVRPDQLLRFR